VLHEAHDGGLVDLIAGHEPAQLLGHAAPHVDDPQQVLSLRLDKTVHKRGLLCIEGRDEALAHVARHRRRYVVTGIPHGRTVLEVEGAEVRAVALRAEVHIGRDRPRVPAEHVAGVRHDGDLLVAAQAAHVLGFGRVGPLEHALADHVVEACALLVGKRAEHAAHDFGALVADLAVELVERG